MENQQEKSRTNNCKNPRRRKQRTKASQKETYPYRDEEGEQRNQNRAACRHEAERQRKPWTNNDDKTSAKKKRDSRTGSVRSQKKRKEKRRKTRQGARSKVGSDAQPAVEAATSNQKRNRKTKPPGNSTMKKTPCMTNPTHHAAP